MNIDPLLFAGLRIRALAALQEVASLPLSEAIDLLGDRQRHLAESAPQRFTVPLDGYWDGFYT
jgi:hypothetical protein